MPIERVDYNSADAAAELDRSLRDTGFALIVNTPLSATLVSSLSRHWLQFFLSAEKTNYAADADLSNSQSGYVSIARAETAVGASVADLKECFHHLPGTRLPVALDREFIAFRQTALRIGRTLAAGLASVGPSEVRGLTDTAAWVDDDATLARIVHYPPLQDAPPGALRAAAHQDINLMTLLPVSEQPGLEVRTRNGEWQALHAEPGALVVNAGDMLRELSADHYPSTRHRVVNPVDTPGNISRIAMPVFLTPEPNQKLSARYTAGEYLHERLSEINPAAES